MFYRVEIMTVMTMMTTNKRKRRGENVRTNDGETMIVNVRITPFFKDRVFM